MTTPDALYPVLMLPDDIIGMKQAQVLSGRDPRTIRRLCQQFGIGHQTMQNAPWEISAPALVMVRHGDYAALELLRCGNREHPRVKRVLNYLGLP